MINPSPQTFQRISMNIDYIDKIAPTVPCSGSSCHICNCTKELNDIVKLRDLKANVIVSLTRSQHATIMEEVKRLILAGNYFGTFDKNDGYTWKDIPLNDGKVATLSVKKTLVNGEPKYEWMLEK